MSLVGLFGDPTRDAITDIVADSAQRPPRETFTGPIESITRSRGTAGVMALGIGGALWAASGYVGAFIRASNMIYEVEEGRPFWKLRPLQVGVTFVLVVAGGRGRAAIVLSGPIAGAVGDASGSATLR